MIDDSERGERRERRKEFEFNVNMFVTLIWEATSEDPTLFGPYVRKMVEAFDAMYGRSSPNGLYRLASLLYVAAGKLGELARERSADA